MPAGRQLAGRQMGGQTVAQQGSGVRCGRRRDRAPPGHRVNSI
jgi:hypothetical protein